MRWAATSVFYQINGYTLAINDGGPSTSCVRRLDGNRLDLWAALRSPFGAAAHVRTSLSIGGNRHQLPRPRVRSPAHDQGKETCLNLRCHRANYRLSSRPIDLLDMHVTQRKGGVAPR